MNPGYSQHLHCGNACLSFPTCPVFSSKQTSCDFQGVPRTYFSHLLDFTPLVTFFLFFFFFVFLKKDRNNPNLPSSELKPLSRAWVLSKPVFVYSECQLGFAGG